MAQVRLVEALERALVLAQEQVQVLEQAVALALQVKAPDYPRAQGWMSYQAVVLAEEQEAAMERAQAMVQVLKGKVQ